MPNAERQRLDAISKLEWACKHYCGWYDGKVSSEAGDVAYTLVSHIRQALAILAAPPVDEPKQPNPCPVCGTFLWGDPRPCWNCVRLAAPPDPAPAEIARLTARLDEMSDENLQWMQDVEELAAWKREALAVLAQWHALGDELQRRYPLRLGDNIPVALLRKLTEPAPGLREALTDADKLLIQRAYYYVDDMRTPSQRATYSIADWNEAAECVIQLVKLATRAARPADTKKEE